MQHYAALCFMANGPQARAPVLAGSIATEIRVDLNILLVESLQIASP